MKKYLYIMLVAALTMTACHKQPAQQEEQSQEETQEQVAETPEQAVDENMYINITGVTPDGKELSLSEFVGQTDFVLLDFWASWCNPCRRFIPVLKEIYRSQPTGRLQILSCSVDKDVMAWQVALNEEQMPWPQMREDDAHICSDVYKVQFIPHTVLIDKAGQIIAVNPEEPEIEEILLGE